MSVKQRKTRIVKNELVSTDDVLCECGASFKNWIKSAKTKLLEREQQILCLRINAIKTRITLVLNELNINNIEHLLNNINMNNFIKPCIDGLQNELNEWNGIRNKNICDFPTFRLYFVKCINWFDKKKIKIMAKTFWIPIIKMIKQFNRNQFNHQYITYSTYLSLIDGKFQIPNTRQTLLISAPIYQSKYLFINELDLHQVINDKIYNGTEIRDLVRNQLIHLINLNDNNNNNNELPNNSNQNVIDDNNNNNNNNNCNNNSICCSICCRICNNYYNNNFCCICCPICNNNYSSTHYSSQSVADHRYNPMKST